MPLLPAALQRGVEAGRVERRGSGGHSSASRRLTLLRIDLSAKATARSGNNTRRALKLSYCGYLRVLSLNQARLLAPIQSAPESHMAR
jgi:hypothetical protein